MGVIDALSAGYRLILRRWWLLLIPILLDAILWVGPQLSVADVAQDLSDLIATPAGMPLTEEYEQATRQYQLILTEMGEQSNLMGLLSAGLPRVPSLLASTTPQAIPVEGWHAVMQVSTTGQAVLYALTLLLGGTLLSAVYVTALGRAVQADAGEPVERPVFPVHTLQTWGRVLLFLLLVLAVLAILSVPVLLVAGFLVLISPSLGLVLIEALSLLLFWIGLLVLVYLYFVVDSIVLNRANLFRAIWNSVNVVIRGFWAAFVLMALIYLIGYGMLLILQRLEFATWGVLVGILVNAFVGCGLTAAGLIFYRERYQRWQERANTLDAALSGPNKPS